MNKLESYLDVLRRVKQVCPEAVVGGGALRDLSAGVEAKDLDLFVDEANKGREIKRILESVLGPGTWHVDPNAAFYFADRPDLYGVVDFGSISGCPLPVQVIVTRGYPSTNLVEYTRHVAGRFDFGICQIVHDGFDYYHTDAWRVDFNNKTFTVVQCDSEDDLNRSRGRFERIAERYPGWQLVVPEDIADGFIPF